MSKNDIKFLNTKLQSFFSGSALEWRRLLAEHCLSYFQWEKAMKKRDA